MADQFVQYPNPSVTVSATALSFTRNGSLQAVTQDTTTPANNRPLVVSLLDSLGNINTVSSVQSGAWTVSATQSGAWNVTNITGTVSLPTGAATQATLAAIAGQLPATLGAKTSAGSLAVVLASDQTSIPTASTQSGAWNITNITGTVSLPTGAATQSTLAAIQAQLPTTLGQKVSASSLAVVLASDQGAVPTSAAQSGAWNITNVTGTVSLPTGAATAALQTALNAQIPATLGAKTSAASLAVVLATDQATLATTLNGSAGVANAPVYNVYTTTAITTAAYTQLVASTTSATNYLEIFDSSGQAMILATGAAAAEVPVYYVPPGGSQIKLNIPAGTRVSMKALTANATSGFLLVNLLK